jgi:hypothetical protein
MILFKRDKATVFARIGKLFLIVALLVTTGAHWAALQSVAWVTMFADNARTAPLSAAFERTFDGKHPCPLCRQVSAGRSSEKKADLQSEVKKIEFVNQSPVFIFAAPEWFILAGRQECFPRSFSFSPPVPPPRNLPV